MGVATYSILLRQIWVKRLCTWLSWPSSMPTRSVTFHLPRKPPELDMRDTGKPAWFNALVAKSASRIWMMAVISRLTIGVVVSWIWLKIFYDTLPCSSSSFFLKGDNLRSRILDIHRLPIGEDNCRFVLLFQDR